MSAQESPPMAGVLRVFFFLALAAVTVATVVSGVFTFYEPPDDGGFSFEGEEEIVPVPAPRPIFSEDDEAPPLSFPQRRQHALAELAPDHADERADYNRNVGLILGLIGAGVMAAGILGLTSRFNALRAALLAAGAGLHLAGVAIAANGSNDWISFVMASLGFITLVGSSPWLENGLPLGRKLPNPRTWTIDRP